jgi:2-polyprenyl-3-methyl-5-hydroxy-6-metoxy-1,4-benzoquinol methylase
MLVGSKVMCKVNLRSHMTYDKTYKEIQDVFGSEPEEILKGFYEQIDRTRSVLDIGAGQGRNSFFLAKAGYTIDAIDPSRISIETINDITKRENYKINVYQQSFDEFSYRNSPYSAILVFGLLQILDLKSISLLTKMIDKYTTNGSIVFITAFSNKDASFNKYGKEWNKASQNSFCDNKGNYRTFFETSEIIELFINYKVLHQWEGLGKKHRHGNSPIEQHSIIQLVMEKNNIKT